VGERVGVRLCVCVSQVAALRSVKYNILDVKAGTLWHQDFATYARGRRVERNSSPRPLGWILTDPTGHPPTAGTKHIAAAP